MIQNTLREIGGVGLYGVVSVVLFFAVFTGALVWAFRLRRPFLDAMGELPLADDNATPNSQENRHE